MVKIDMKNFRLCPKCKSADVELKPVPLEVMGGMLPFTIKCNKCGFESKISAEIELNQTRRGKIHKKINYPSINGGISINKKCQKNQN